MTEQPSSLFEAIGGEPMFDRIVTEFYRQIPEDPILGPMYPAEDMAGAEDRLRWFLMQYWGGPQTFNEQRGHPRLRMRHMHFHINPAARERWLVLMGNARRPFPVTCRNAPPLGPWYAWRTCW